jgi:ABC-type uncharacterized transport system involved in gliding motility auxiliary subunit
MRFVAFERVQEFPLPQTLLLLEMYRAENRDSVAIDVVDPVERPDVVERYALAPGDALVLAYGERGHEQFERLNDVSEEAITAAALRLIRGEKKKIYVIQGHGEPSLTGNRPEALSAFVKAVEREHLSVADLFLGDRSSLPEDAAAVILAAPRKPLLETEQALLEQFLENGGRMLILVEPQHATHVRSLAEKFGILIDENVIIDRAERGVGTAKLGAQPIVRTFEYHPSTVMFSEKTPVVLNVASSVRVRDGFQESGTELMRTGAGAWGETDLEGVFKSSPPRAEQGEGDFLGPVPVAAAIEWGTSGEAEERAPGRLVVVGDTDWLLNANLHWFSNQDLGLNLIGWLSEIEAGVTIRPRALRTSLVTISRSSYLFIVVVSLLVPELLLLVGLCIWYWRHFLIGAVKGS